MANIPINGDKKSGKTSFLVIVVVSGIVYFCKLENNTYT